MKGASDGLPYRRMLHLIRTPAHSPGSLASHIPPSSLVVVFRRSNGVFSDRSRYSEADAIALSAGYPIIQTATLLEIRMKGNRKHRPYPRHFTRLMRLLMMIVVLSWHTLGEHVAESRRDAEGRDGAGRSCDIAGTGARC